MAMFLGSDTDNVPSYRAFSARRSGGDSANRGKDNARIAGAKSLGVLIAQDSAWSLEIEKSVYGSAMALPQIARSCGWPVAFISVSIQSYVFLALNLFVQGYLIAAIAEENRVMSPFAGRMELCNFGAVQNSIGPGGTPYSPPRLYSFDVWNTRLFIRDSVKASFPMLDGVIGETIDPGEWGIESIYSRWIACFLFTIVILDDLRQTLTLLMVLFTVPSKAEPWISYEIPDWGTKNFAKQVHGWSEMDLIKYRVAGMPLVWKIANFSIVVLPKLVLWLSFSTAGFHFLLSTADIVNGTINAMALSFILEVDELILSGLCSISARHIMDNLEVYESADTDVVEELEDEELLRRFAKNEDVRSLSDFFTAGTLRSLLPERELLVIVFLLFFLGKYYYTNCRFDDDGNLVSKDLYLPTKVGVNVWVFLGFPTSQEPEPVWTMHEAK